MKKSLFAIAAVTAFAGAAQAQSSVTVYGILDVGFVGANERVSSNAISSNGGQYKKTQNSFGGVGAESTSRLGFKGNEDLGGGMSAFFTAEFALYPEDQTLSGNTTSSTGSNNSAGLQNRQTFVGLKKNGIGSTAIGTQYTPVFNANAATNPNGSNNMLGDLVYQGTTMSASTNGTNGANSASFTNRTSNALTLQSDSFAGFRANALYTLNNKVESSQANAAGQVTSGGNTNASGWGLGADYTIQKFYASAAYQSLKQLTSANAYTSVTGVPATTSTVWGSAQANGATSSPGTSSNGVDIQDNQFLAGATYDFGILKAYAQYVNRKATSTITPNYYAKRTAEQIGVRSFITPKIEAWASGSLGRYTAYGVNQPTANMNAWQLGSNYYLSKRTNLYAIYGQQIISTSSAGTISGSASASNYAVGVRHTF
jgi:predicted porin